MASKISRTNMMRYINNRMHEIKENIQAKMKNCYRSDEQTSRDIDNINATISNEFAKLKLKKIPEIYRKYILTNNRHRWIGNWDFLQIHGNFKSPADEKEYNRLQKLIHSLPAKRREIENKLIVGSADPALVSEIEKILSTLK